MIETWETKPEYQELLQRPIINYRKIEAKKQLAIKKRKLKSKK